VKTAAALIAFALLAGPSTRWDWGDAKEDWYDASAYAESKALCRSLRGREPPAGDRPDAAAANALKGCDSEALYYGIGMPADPVKARQCAFLEADADSGAVFAGRTMLMTIYANGRGAKRDLDVAIHLACGIEGAPAESDGRVLHLAELKTKGWKGDDFHFCDDVTSGLAMGYCAGHGASIAEAERKVRWSRLTAGWSAAEKRSLDALAKAHEAFVEAHSDGEVDLSGTARAAMQIGAEEALRDELLEMVEALAAGGKPPFAAGDYAAADARLNAAYRKARAEAAPDSEAGGGMVTKAGILTAQRAWLRYRDAFLAFAAVRFATVPRGALAAWLTSKRTATLLPEE
jgi:hypothetical protein